MKNLSRIFTSLILSIVCILFFVTPFRLDIFSGEIEDLEQEIEEKQEEIEENKSLLEQIEERISEISNSKYSLSEKISLLGKEISEIEEQIEEKEEEIDTKLKEIDAKEKLLAEKQVLLESVSGELYVESRFGFYNFLFSGKGLDDLIESLFVRKAAISLLTDEIEEISGEFSNLAEAKTNLLEEKDLLDEEKGVLDDSYDLLAAERSKLQAELNAQYAQKSVLSAEITDLTKKVSQLQEAIIASRSAGLISTGGTTGTEEGTAISQAPSGYWGVFSIGAYTHRNGMSQWGARARAEAGQTYEEILDAYYPSTTLNKNYTEPSMIHVKGTGNSCTCQIYNKDGSCASYEKYYDVEISFGTYMNRIFEMPPSWDVDAVKAQAIATRSYAIYEYKRKGYVIPSQSDQVYKDCDNTSAWKSAVSATKNQVLVSGSSPHKAFFAAVHGGWGDDVGWDTQSGNGNDWFNDAWEKISGVNWFYKSWYRYGYTTSGTNCGHSPWLSPTEMAAMVNSYKIKNGIGVKNNPDLSRLLPIDYGLCPGREDYERTDKDPYTPSELKSFLSNPVNTVYSASVALSNGNTTGVTFYTDAGNISMSGMLFKNIYNQTAPGHMRIQQQSDYAYFNIERK